MDQSPDGKEGGSRLTHTPAFAPSEDPRKTVTDPFLRLLRLRAGGAVKRYHTFPTHGNQDVGAHSHAVALFILSFHPNPSLNLIKACLFHDLAEYDTGDCPANVKWAFPVMDNMLKLAESNIDQQLKIDVELTAEEEKWLKCADTLEYCLYSLDQRRLGNLNMDIVFGRGMKRLESYPLALENADVREFINSLKWAYKQAQQGYAPISVAITHDHSLDD